MQFARWTHSSIESVSSRVRSLLRAMRVYQWVKNLLVFVPLITANRLLDASAFLDAVGAFLSLCLVASGVYLLNDLTDLNADRLHPRKRYRPFASGELPLKWGLVLGPAFIANGLIAGFLIAPALAGVLLLYVVSTSVYSLVLKTKSVLDVFVLAALYTIRVVAGGTATGIEPSIWLLNFSGLFFLSLAFLKRYVEVCDLPRSGRHAAPRRGYGVTDHMVLAVMGAGSGIASSIVLALYVDTSFAAAIYRAPRALWGVVPVCLFWHCHMWLAAARGEVDDDPIVYAAKDPVSWATGTLVAACYCLALLGPSPRIL